MLVSALVICFSKHLNVNIWLQLWSGGAVLFWAMITGASCHVTTYKICLYKKKKKRARSSDAIFSHLWPFPLLWDFSFLFLIASSLLTLTVTSCKRYLCTSSKSWFEDLFLYYYKVKCVLNIQDLFWGGKNGLSWFVIAYSVNIPKWQFTTCILSCWIGGERWRVYFLSLLTWILTLALFLNTYKCIHPSLPNDMTG